MSYCIKYKEEEDLLSHCFYRKEEKIPTGNGTTYEKLKHYCEFNNIYLKIGWWAGVYLLCCLDEDERSIKHYLNYIQGVGESFIIMSCLDKKIIKKLNKNYKYHIKIRKYKFEDKK